MEKRNIYDLKLHEELFIEDNNESGVWVRRVPGGWLYNYEDPVFVPFNDEFMICKR